MKPLKKKKNIVRLEFIHHFLFLEYQNAVSKNLLSPTEISKVLQKKARYMWKKKQKEKENLEYLINPHYYISYKLTQVKIGTWCIWLDQQMKLKIWINQSILKKFQISFCLFFYSLKER